MKKILLPALFLFSFSIGLSQEDSYKENLIEYMKSQGQFETFSSTFNQMAGMFGISESDEKFEKLQKEMIDDLIKLMVPIYKKHFSEEELKQAIELYKTPIGLKIAEKNPVIAKESMQASMQWGMEFGNKIQEILN